MAETTKGRVQASRPRPRSGGLICMAPPRRGHWRRLRKAGPEWLRGLWGGRGGADASPKMLPPPLPPPRDGFGSGSGSGSVITGSWTARGSAAAARVH
jgi:hypothetical protein